jgi:cell division protein FtsZ
MSETPVPSEPTPSFAGKLSIKVIGVGDAGSIMVARTASRGFAQVSFAALCSSSRALAALDLPDKRAIGLKTTRGFGAGGDPLLGRAAAEGDIESIRQVCAGANMIFLVAGLGGGLGAGAAPVVARAARESGALVLAMATLPFNFEGARRARQAEDALQELKSVADAVICLPNQRIFPLIDGQTPHTDTFKLTQNLAADGIIGVCRLVTQSGLITVDFGDLCAATRGRHVESAFAAVEAGGVDRCNQLVERLLGHPLLDKGRALCEAESLLVSLQGGPDLTMAEVNQVMECVNSRSQSANVMFGASIDPAMTGRMGLLVIAAKLGGDPAEIAPRGIRPEPRQPEIAAEIGTEPRETAPAPRAPSRYVAPPPELSEDQKEKMFSRQPGGSRKKAFRNPLQTQLQLQIVSKGRFEKSEPTLHHGEDLDIPTYVRRGVSLN